MIEFSFNILPRKFLIASLLRRVSDFTADVFLLKKELFSWTYLLKKTPRRNKILMSPVWNKILNFWDKLFELIQIEVQYGKKYFKDIFFYHKKLELLEIIEKELQKPRLKVKKYVYIFTGNISSTCSPIQIVAFFKPVFFSHFEGTIIP